MNHGNSVYESMQLHHAVLLLYRYREKTLYYNANSTLLPVYSKQTPPSQSQTPPIHPISHSSVHPFSYPLNLPLSEESTTPIHLKPLHTHHSLLQPTHTSNPPRQPYASPPPISENNPEAHPSSQNSIHHVIVSSSTATTHPADRPPATSPDHHTPTPSTSDRPHHPRRISHPLHSASRELCCRCTESCERRARCRARGFLADYVSILLSRSCHLARSYTPFHRTCLSGRRGPATCTYRSASVVVSCANFMWSGRSAAGVGLDEDKTDPHGIPPVGFGEVACDMQAQAGSAWLVQYMYRAVVSWCTGNCSSSAYLSCPFIHPPTTVP